MFCRGLKQALAAAEAENERLRGDNAALRDETTGWRRKRAIERYVDGDLEGGLTELRAMEQSNGTVMDGLSRMLNDAAGGAARTA